MLDEFKKLNFLQRVLKLKSMFAEAGGIVATGDGQGITRPGSDADRSFQFIQLSDFIKDAYKYCTDLDILPMVSEVVGDKAVMTLYDATKEIEEQPNPLKIEISSLRTSGLGEMQGIGSQITFSRRYLWITFLDLCARDELDEGVYNEEIEKAISEKEEKEKEEKKEAVKDRTKKKAPEKPTSNVRSASGEEKSSEKTEEKPVEKAEEKKEAVEDKAVSTEKKPAETPVKKAEADPAPTVEPTEKSENLENSVVEQKEKLFAEIQRVKNYKSDLLKIKDKTELMKCIFGLYGMNPDDKANSEVWEALAKKTIDQLKDKAFHVCDRQIENYQKQLAELG